MKAQENTQKPTIAIAGSSGRIGSRLKHYLSPHYNIISLQRTLSLSSHNESRDTILQLDITDNKSVENAINHLIRLQVRTIVNCIGDLNIDGEEHTRGDKNSTMYRVNVTGPKNLARVCRQENLKLVHLSTEYIFDGRKPAGETYTELDEPNVSLESAPTWYGITKALGEKEVLAAYPDGSVVVRFCQIQSPLGGLFASTIKLLGMNQLFTRASNQMISPLTDATASEALLYIEKAVHEKNFRGIIHVSASDAHSCFEISRMLANVYGLHKKAEKLITPTSLEELVASGEQKAHRPHNPILNMEKFNKLFGLKILGKTQKEIKRFHNLYPLIS